MLLDRKIWAIASGKGGTGKSMLAASMACHLADLGFKVMLVDADLACANLHTLFGIEWPARTIADFIDRRLENLEEIALPTELPNLRLIAGALDPLEASLIRYQQKRRVLRQLNTLPEDVVILDLPTGASVSLVELFNGADLGLFVLLPEPTSLENSYRLLRMIYFARIREIPGWKKFERNLPPSLFSGQTKPLQFLEEVDKINPKWSRLICRRMEFFTPGIVTNQVRTKEDRDLGPAISLVCRRYFGLEAPFLGSIDYDESVYLSTRHRKPVIRDYPHSRPSRSIRQITENLLSLARRKT